MTVTLNYQDFQEYAKPCTLKLKNKVVNCPGKKPNLLIEGENLDSLTLLKDKYTGKVDAAYLDPPYNIGGKTTYKTSFNEDRWMSFLKHRLDLCKSLLKPDDSCLILTISYKDVAPVGVLLKECFPKAKIQLISIYLGSIHPSPAKFSQTNEFIYFVMIGKSHVERIERDPDFALDHSENINVWNNLEHTHDSSNDKELYPIYIKDKKIVHTGDPVDEKDKDKVPDWNGIKPLLPGDGRVWILRSPTLWKMYKDGFVRVKDNGKLEYITSGKAKRIRSGEWVLSEDKNTVLNQKQIHIPTTIWQVRLHSSSNGTNILKQIVGKTDFLYPKSLYNVEDCLSYFVKDKPEAVILDPYAGSGTVSHAVFRLNKEYGGNRICIALTNNENKICESVTWPRLRNSILGEKENGKKLEGDYKGIDRSPLSDGFKENLDYFVLDYENK